MADPTVPALDVTAPEALLPFIPRTAKRVLDCGCGNGARGALLKAQGVQAVIGLEQDPALGTEARRVLDRVVVGELDNPDTKLGATQFDCILCIDVLAQLRDPAPFLERMLGALAPGGLLVATMPNLQHYETVFMLAEGRWDYEEQGATARNHLRFFTAVEILRLFRNGGFTVHKCGALVSDDPAALPKDDEGYVQCGRVKLGPLREEEYRAFLTRQYIVYAGKS